MTNRRKIQRSKRIYGNLNVNKRRVVYKKTIKSRVISNGKSMDKLLKANVCHEVTAYVPYYDIIYAKLMKHAEELCRSKINEEFGEAT